MDEARNIVGSRKLNTKRLLGYLSNVRLKKIVKYPDSNPQAIIDLVRDRRVNKATKLSMLKVVRYLGTEEAKRLICYQHFIRVFNHHIKPNQKRYSEVSSTKMYKTRPSRGHEEWRCWS